VTTSEPLTFLCGRADRGMRTVSANQTKTMGPVRQSHNATITDHKKSSGPIFIQWPQNPCANKPQNTHVSYSISVIVTHFAPNMPQT